MIYYFQKVVVLVFAKVQGLPLIFGSSHIPDKNSKIRRKFYYLEKLNSKIGRKTYYLEKLN
jgi:hypothetical protein